MRYFTTDTVCITVILILLSLTALSGPAYCADRMITDTMITRAIENGLAKDRDASFHLIDVETKEGIVTLSGIADDLFSKDRAVRIAATVRGVRSVVNMIRIEPVVREDSAIAQDVRDALLYDPATESYEIKVEVDGGTAILSGSVDSYAERELAAAVVKQVKGVLDVRSDITVLYKESRPDREIKADLERRIRIDPYISSESIEVSVKDGRVTLTGRVNSAFEKTRAYKDSWVMGVRSVDDSGLEVAPQLRDTLKRRDIFTDRSDEEIARAAKDALAYDPRTSAFDIRIDVISGIAVLKGMVDNLMAKRAAERDVDNTIGVARVNNNLKVRSAAPPVDRSIAEGIKKALQRDAVLERNDFAVSVVNRKVYLNGEVESPYEREHAEDVVARVMGVVDIVNHVKVKRPKEWKSDTAIRDDVEDELFWSVFLDADDISVNVKDGTAVLHGVVDNEFEMHLAIKNAFEGGARAVRNRLKIKGGPEADQLYYDDSIFYPSPEYNDQYPGVR